VVGVSCVFLFLFGSPFILITLPAKNVTFDDVTFPAKYYKEEEAFFHFIYLLVIGLVVAISCFYQEVYERVHMFRLHTLKNQKRVVTEQEQRSNKLLLKLLPENIVEQLKNGRDFIADHFESATVLFTDMKGFTAFSSKVTPQELVFFLNRMYSAFDEITDEEGVYKASSLVETPCLDATLGPHVHCHRFYVFSLCALNVTNPTCTHLQVFLMLRPLTAFELTLLLVSV